MNRLVLVVLLAQVTVSGVSQTVLENNPPSIRWSQINTPNFRLLFPRGFEEQGQRMANTLEHIRTEEAQSLGGSVPRKISIILQSHSTASNGFVSVLPRRSEFYAMPAQDYNFTGTNDWLNLLASHEYRHMVQYQHATRGFNKFLFYVFGATTLAGMSQAAAPDWFWEGDAVATETAFTPAGRGKIPNFSLVFRTNLLEGREFNYHKQYLRSYKHNIPDEYVLGYHMVSYLRRRTNDPGIWGKITARSWSVPFIPFAFSNAIKKETGLYVTGLYREMARDYQARWKEALDQLTLTPLEKVNARESKAYTDYLYPQPLVDGSIAVLKRGIGEIDQFVLLAEGRERKVFTPGFINDSGMLSVGNGLLVWNEYGFDPRWRVRNYSLVKAYDIDQGYRRVIGSNKARYGSAAISPDGATVVTIRTRTDYTTNIVLLEAKTGKEIREFENPENHFYSMPRWSHDGKRIAVLKTANGKRSVAVLEAATGSVEEVIPPSTENVGYPVLFGNYLFYNSPLTGIDNIFAMDLSTRKRFQVTSSRYGAYNPAVTMDGKTIVYNDQSRDGMDVVKIPLDPASWRPVEPAASHQDYEHLVTQEGDRDLFHTVPSKVYPVTKYSKSRGFLNPYTWGLNVESDLTQAVVGISSKDILSTTAINLGYVFDIHERTGAWKGEVSYQGFFPVLDLSVSFANRSVDEGNIQYERIISDDTITFVNNLTFEWKETTVTGGLRIPLVITNGSHSGSITFGNEIGYTRVRDFSNSIDGGGRIVPSALPRYIFRSYVDQGALLYNHFSLDAYRLLKRSRRDINSRWGQRLLVDFYNTPYGGDFSGKQFSAYGILYFPGIMKHHSFWGYGAYQRSEIPQAFIDTGEGLDNYTFRNRVPLPRGHSVARLEEFFSSSANYTFPIWYPDVAVGPLLNFQRLRTNLFFDYGYGESKNFDATRMYASAGAEVKLDLNVMRFYPQFDIGVRYTKGLHPATSSFEVLIGTFNF